MPLEDDHEALLRVNSDVERLLTDLTRVRDGLAGLGEQTRRTQQHVQTFSQATARAFNETFTGIILGTRNASSALGGFVASLARSFGAILLARIGSVGTVIAGVGTMLVATGAAALVAARHFSEFAEQLKNAAVQAGVSVEFYQRVQRVLVSTGLGAETANRQLRFFARSVDEAARGGGDAALIFQRLRVGVHDVAGEVRPLEDLFDEFVGRLVNVSKASEQAALTARVFGREGQTLLPFFREWAAAQADATKRSAALAGVLGRETVEAALKVNTQWTRMSTALRDLWNLMGAAGVVISGPFVRGLRGLAESVRDAATWIALMTGVIDDIPRATRAATEGVIDLANEQKKRVVEDALAVAEAEGALSAARARRRAAERQALDIEHKARVAAIAIERELVLNTTTATGEEHSRIIRSYDRKLDAENLAHKKNLEDADAEAAARRSLRQIAAERQALDDLTAIDEAGLRAMQALRQVADEDALDQQTAFTLQRLEHQRAAAEKERVLETTTLQRRADLVVELEAVERQKSLVVARAEADRAEIRRRAADTARDVEALTVRAFGTDTQQRLHALVREHDEWIERLRELKREDLIPAVTAAYRRMAADIRGVIVDLNAIVKTSIEDMFAGAILGTRKMSDVFEALRVSLVKQFASAFAEMLLKKLEFEAQFALNVTRDLPEIAAVGAEGIAKPFGAMFSLLSGGSGVSRGIDVSPAGVASWIGGPPATVGGGWATAFNVQQQAGRLAAVGLSSAQVQAIIGQGGALAAGTGAAGGANLGSTAIPVIGSALAVGSILADLSKTGDTAGKAGIVGGAAIGATVGAAGGPVGMIAGAIVGGVISTIITAFGFGHERKDVIEQQLTKAFDKYGIPIHPLLDPFEDTFTRSRIMKRFPEFYPGGVFTRTPELRALEPATSAVAAAAFPDPKVAAKFREAFLVDMQALGVSAETAKDQLLEFAAAIGMNLNNALKENTRAFLEGRLSVDDYRENVAALIELFLQLPKGIDATTVALEAMGEDGVASVKKLKKIMDDFATSQRIMATALRAAFEAMIPETEEERAARERDAERRKTDYDVAQMQSAARVKFLRDQAAQARSLGNSVRAAELDMELASELAAQDGARRLRELEETTEKLTPQQAFVRSLKDGIRSAVIDAIVEAIVAGGIIDVILAPFFKELRAAAAVLSDPNATAAEVDAAMNRVYGSLAGVGEQVDLFWQRIQPVLESPQLGAILSGDWPTAAAATPERFPGVNVGQKVPGIDLGKVVDTGGPLNPADFPGGVVVSKSPWADIPSLAQLQHGGLVTRPTLALLGERGPEMVTPLGRGAAAVHITVNVTGNYVLNDRDADGLARVVGDAMMRRVKQHRLLG